MYFLRRYGFYIIFFSFGVLESLGGGNIWFWLWEIGSIRKSQY